MSNREIRTLLIDGKEVTAVEGESILDVARQNEIDIPTLCHLDGLSSTGACRMCLVEVRGASKLMPACVTRAEQGMEVTTDSERIRKYRKMILELVFAERNHTCAVCVSNGHCDLQSLAQKLGVDHIRYTYRNRRYGVDASHPRFDLDHNRCMLCTRCVRVCDEIEGVHTWDLSNRGIQTQVVCDLNVDWGSSSSCTSCGKCVNVCPTGALAEKGKSVAEMTKRRGFLPYVLMRREVK